MEEYIVSARKYRPMSFDSVVGQSALTTTLKNAVKSGKLAHAYLFCGPRGVGKTTCARIFAKAINCQNPTAEGEACNECESCKAFNEQRSYNIFELDAASNNSVENIKTLMEQTRIPPQVGKYKVFIIDEVHMLSTAAFNAFLKTLEEPPAHVVFILATTEKHKILPTILSRCQIYDFERITVPGIINHLKMVAEKEGITYEEEALNVIAEKADGGMRDALSVFDQAASFCQGNITYQKVIEDLNVLDSDNYFRIVDLCMENKVADVMVLLNNVLAKGFDGGNLIGGLASHVRNVLMAKDNQTIPLLQVSESQAEKYKAQAAKCPTKFLYKALKIMNECDVNYRQSSNKRLLVELTLIRVAQITQPDDDDSVAGRSPKRLKSLFKKLIASAQQRTASQVAAAAPATQQGGQPAVQGDAASGNAQTTGQSVAADNAAAQTQEGSSVPQRPRPAPVKLGNIGKSFANLRKGPEKPAYEVEPELKYTGLHEQFDEDMLLLQWLSMCSRMPQQMASTAVRMKNIMPKILEFPEIEVVVDNKMLLEDIQKIQKRIRNTLVQKLRNDDIKLTLRLARQDEVKHILSSRELYDKLCSQNPAVKKLGEIFKLEFA
ncbi:DNA polymerase III subunit gamma/tau [uncultured Prevotella sp.]|uniref:DNA polymerase III subunit gamma/tau n=1 Tax=uncultured Prevotella sp. TaxID=159272 RepID=UPI00260A8281|nr:DNA polymerase III subunit gamma/tau [uncultured Prevotella sp.]